ncbi:hypothetical protein TrVE_jg2891 [Triparma verrucosa]|uniref:Uncharacterized protein n=1 Tax=Triparma verrucosa TaxID=1606542 RepID=A0A9W7F4W2_9STRA|nr:hypothetical protein TrVE_jg2891 [Triparma verrucosa]
MAVAAPSGEYSGSKTVLGQSINAKISATSDTSMDLSISGVIELSCSDEAYHMSGADILIDNIAQAGDCAHDALEENSVTLEKSVYDEAADTITVSVKYSVMSIDLVLTKGSSNFVIALPADLATTPSGAYSGSKTVLGQTINAMVSANTDTSMDLSISGVISLSCTDEAYHLDGSDIVVDNIAQAGDCAHDALEENGVTLKGVTYDESSDTITVSVKYSVMSIDLVLTKTSDDFQVVVTVLSDPEGTYSGSKTVLGQTINAVVTSNSATSMDLSISGVISLSCTDEAYHLDGSDIVVDNIAQAGDCAHDALEENGVTLKGVTYDESSDTITVSVKYSVMSIDLVLSKASSKYPTKTFPMAKNMLRGSATQ